MNAGAVRAPCPDLLPILRQEMRRKIQSKEFVTRPQSDRTMSSIEDSLSLQEICGGITIAMGGGRICRYDFEISAAAAAKLGPNRPNNPLDSGLRVMTNDCGHIDDQAGPLMAGTFCRLPAVTPQPGVP